MKLIMTMALATISLTSIAQEKKQTKEPPKVIKVVKTPPAVLTKEEVKSKSPKKFKHKPVPKVEVVKFTPPKIVRDTVNRKQ